MLDRCALGCCFAENRRTPTTTSGATISRAFVDGRLTDVLTPRTGRDRAPPCSSISSVSCLGVRAQARNRRTVQLAATNVGSAVMYRSAASKADHPQRPSFTTPLQPAISVSARPGESRGLEPRHSSRASARRRSCCQTRDDAGGARSSLPRAVRAQSAPWETCA